MTPPNLALIFAPNLLRPRSMPAARLLFASHLFSSATDNSDFVAMMQDSPFANRMLEIFVTHYEASSRLCVTSSTHPLILEQGVV